MLPPSLIRFTPIVVLAWCSVLAAQHTRLVTEPIIPPRLQIVACIPLGPWGHTFK